MAAERPTRAALWVSPQRIAISVVAAGFLSAASATGNGLLKKDVVPESPQVQAPHLMRREPKETASPPAERPEQWGHLMRKEAKVAVAPATGRAPGPAMFVAMIFGALAIYSFGQQLRSAFKLLVQGSGYDLKGK
ncbi:unnamed protein product [Effrenium voratum]|uniref:Uncharacterized protein n=1 Tax=Effrenium voratum TaxID=2562239 RepID=A0AA36JBP1_9DINO|nr:unnamed protein product [Effrenium voratum]